jgi:hypothetical protein
MHTTQLASSATLIRLSAGQCYHLCSGRDASLLVQSGTVRLREAPHWIAGTLISLQTDLQDGQHHLLQQRGWICIQATRDSLLTYHASTTPGHAPIAWLRQVIAHTTAAGQRLQRKIRQWLALR